MEVLFFESLCKDVQGLFASRFTVNRTKGTDQANQPSRSTIFLTLSERGGDNKPTGPLHNFFSKTCQSWQFTHFRKKNVPVFWKKAEHRQLA